MVSAAAGAVGSVVRPARQGRGRAGWWESRVARRSALLTDELGFDAAVDHRADDWAAQLKAATPDGIDVDFENVGGALMDAIFARLNIGARVALCGLISEYNAEDPPPGPRARATCSSSARWSRLHRPRPLRPGAGGDHRIAGLMQQGKLKPLETVVEGFEQLPTAINMLFDGRTSGSWSSRSADPVCSQPGVAR